MNFIYYKFISLIIDYSTHISEVCKVNSVMTNLLKTYYKNFIQNAIIIHYVPTNQYWIMKYLPV